MGILVASTLEQIGQSLNYADLPETWRVPEIDRFSVAKTLYDYQTDALTKAARTLFLYYGKEHDWIPGELQAANKMMSLMQAACILIWFPCAQYNAIAKGGLAMR